MKVIGIIGWGESELRIQKSEFRIQKGEEPQIDADGRRLGVAMAVCGRGGNMAGG